ncbi:HAD family hydrolase [Nonomuraea bangladeshensis]|uniref:HAD family hydrolase n=1 Tax=Nonomuraea bangladeshensis TaxID=404385 RepID=UPI0031E46378
MGRLPATHATPRAVLSGRPGRHSRPAKRRLAGGDRHQRHGGQPARQAPPYRPRRCGRRLRRSGAEGIRKPERGLFEIAAQRCGAGLAEGGWMVGDSLVADVEGGQAAGLRTIWIDRGTWPDHRHHADHVIADISEAFVIMRDAP